ncbi:hypothetical protein EGH21_04465 [Halomicroarcula sp. F13]|uniref:Uncharacterized protein n=1 Tax=Haloarcula rubra TaxID=2487747 RepID=A0AAW4PMB8_9EURY|nr:hypothetical protein [Halomicroarcula rubra]MBX0322285.1 hypothetical protein [Halomicroarcula rubra]
MSFPEGPMEAEQSYDDSHDAVDRAPTDGLIATVTRAIRTHVETWSDRYVEMRVEARTGRR